MRIDPEIKEAIGLEKEMKMFQKAAARPGAPKLEADYYSNLAERTARKINWRALEKRNKKIVREES